MCVCTGSVKPVFVHVFVCSTAAVLELTVSTAVRCVHMIYNQIKRGCGLERPYGSTGDPAEGCCRQKVRPHSHVRTRFLR